MNLDLSNNTFGLTNSESLSYADPLAYWLNHVRKLGPWAFRPKTVMISIIALPDIG